ncbi:MAG: hypothetical protein KFB93_01395 [Simkaniaceae bacterium]|nr:MAG: hypothetical protein KFB93_01395 [Simkaniaceae bacterium]
MKSKGVRIRDGMPDDDEILGVSPKDILKYINFGNELHWAILEIEATGDLGEKKWKELHQCETSDEKMTRISWNDLKDTSKKFRQVIWFTAIGCKDPADVKFYKEDVEMYESCDIVVQVFDGECCEVFSKDHDLIDRLAKKFKDTEFLTPDWNSK